MSKSKGGRPSKLTPEVEAKILAHLETCCYRWAAARLAGISTQTFYNWIKAGERQERGKYRSFLDKVEAAEAEAQRRLLLGIQVQGKDDWKALAWLAEHRFPRDFGMKLQLLLQDEREKDVRELIKVVKDVCGPDTARVLEALARRNSE